MVINSWEIERSKEKDAQIKALQEIRDNPNAAPADRLKAVELLIKHYGR